MVNIRASVDATGAIRLMKKMRGRTKRDAKQLVNNISRYTQRRARSYAPRDTGRTKTHIRIHQTGKQTRTVVAENPSIYGHRGFNLPKWMHADSVQSAGYFPANKPEDHINTGEPKFMDLARRDALKRIRQLTQD